MLPALARRSMAAQMLYMGSGEKSPQEQFIEILRERKIKVLAEQGEADRAKRDYVIKISMPEVLDKSGNEMIWCRIRVSGATKLGVLQDKIIQPAMG